MLKGLEPLVHPVSGELLDPDDLDGLKKARAAADDYLSGWYAMLYPKRSLLGKVQERIAELEGPPAVPRVRDQSPAQRRMVSCPRCGHKLEDAA